MATTTSSNNIGVILSPTVQDQVDVGTSNILKSPHVSQGPGRIAQAPVPSVFSDDRGDIHRLRVGHVAAIYSSSSNLSSKNKKKGGSTSTTPSTRGTRINLLYSKANIMRSGYLHPIPKRDYVLRGKVELWTLTDNETLKTVYDSDTSFEIDAYTPHIFHFLEDTVLIEWWWWPEQEQEQEQKDDGAVEQHATTNKDSTTSGGDLECWFYHPYRRIVDVHNSLIAPSTGHFQRLIPQDSSAADKRRGVSSGDGGYSRSSGGSSLGYNILWWTTGFVVGTALSAAVCIVAFAGDKEGGAGAGTTGRASSTPKLR